MEGREGYSLQMNVEEDEDEFRSCCEDESELKEMELKDDLDEFSVKMFFKGVSITRGKDFGSGFSGIGVVMEREPNIPYIQVQKKLEFYVDNYVADYLALIDGLLEALQKNVKRVFAYTDSETLYNQLMLDGGIENPLLSAMRERVFHHARNLESFVVKLVDKIEIERPLHLAQVAIGIIYSSSKDEKSVQTCSICCEEIPSQMMLTITCSHKFCTHCLKTYVDDNVQSAQVPISCPQLRCKHYISSMECGSFLTLDSFESLKKAFADANIQDDDNFYCPYEDCSALFGFHENLLKNTTRLSSKADNNYLECPDCCRAICFECRSPWHSSMTCEELQNLTTVTSDNDNSISRDRRWRRCQECLQVIEHNHGSYHITCRCGHEFCYSCGDGYRNGQQTCECASWNGEETSDAVTDDAVREEYERWAWDSFDLLPTIMDGAYTEQERSQLRLIQRFLAGGFTLGDNQPSYESSPPACTEESSYVDPMKDLHQVPWLERFVSVITDNYNEEYMQ